MSSPNDTIRKMLLAQLRDDAGAFRSAVQEFIAEEKKKSHHVVARDLERLLDGGGEVRRLQPIRSLFAWEPDIPKDGDRGLPLLQVREPAVDLDRLVLSAGVRGQIERFVRENVQGELLRLHGVAPPTRLLLCGPPGCGKTTAAEAVAAALRLPFAVVRFDVIISSFLGETSANLRRIFDFIGSRPMVALFDEFDGIGKHRGDDLEHGELKRVVNAFLQMLDAFRGESILIAATNHEGLLDPALWRRFDEIALLERPTVDERLAVLRGALRQIGVEVTTDWAGLARATEGMAHADVERVAVVAIRETILAGRDRVASAALLQAAERCRARLILAEGRPKAATSGATLVARVDGAGMVENSNALLAERSEPAPASAPVSGAEDAAGPKTTAPSPRRRTKSRNKAGVRPRNREEGGATGDGDDEATSDAGG